MAGGKRTQVAGGGAVARIDAVWTRLAVAELRRRGVEPGAALAAARLTEAALADRDSRIPFRAHAAFLEAAAAASGDPRFGLALAGRVDARDAGLIAYVCLNARNFGEALRNLDRYIVVFNEAARMKLTATRERLDVEFGFADRGRHRQAQEFGVALFVGALRAAMPRGLAPLEIQFMHPHRGGGAAFARALGCPVAFGRGRTSVRFEPGIASRPLAGADDRLLGVLVGYCRETLARRWPASDDLRQQVEQEILARLQGGEARIDRVAAALGMSERTLARRLGAQEASFASILRDLRKDLASRYLDDSGLGLDEVAFLVGFADASAFSHAFKRWTGEQPGAFRRRGAGAGAGAAA